MHNTSSGMGLPQAIFNDYSIGNSPNIWCTLAIGLYHRGLLWKLHQTFLPDVTPYRGIKLRHQHVHLGPQLAKSRI